MTDRLGTLTETNDGWELRFVRQLDKPLETAWRAFVDPELLAKWFPDTIIGVVEPGASLEFGSEYVPAFSGKVLDLDAPRLLVLLWGTDELRFELAPAGGATELTLTVSFSEQGKAARDGAGWHECLDHLVQVFDEGYAVHVWGTIHPSYVEHFGPAASTIGPPEGHPA